MAQPSQHPARVLAFNSIVIAVVVLLLKALAAWQTGSVAIYSDAVESIVNIVTAIAAFAAILYSARPPDDNHPYGHQKAEYFVALLEAVLIGAAAFAILSASWERLFNPREVELQPAALIAILLATLFNGGWCYWLIKRGKALSSLALEADGWHLYADVISSIGVIAGVFLAVVTGYGWLDPLLAIVVAGNILWSGFKLLKMSLGGLMDMAPDETTRQLIRESIIAAGSGAMEAHDVKARRAGDVIFIDFHLVVDGRISVSQSHGICDRIEAAIRARLGNARISIHVEPAEEAHEQDAIQL